MRLSDIKINQSCTVVSVDRCLDLSNRLKELGFTKGQKVTCTDISFCGSPVAYKLCGTKIALRNNAAHNIEVKLNEN